MAKNQEGISLIPTRFQHAEIPISVATLIIDGKRLTSAFYKQITEADLIDEDSGELRGDPLGYFHLHSKACPGVSHTHVLWAMETELHLATVVSPEQDERYQQQEQASRERKDHLIRLLALLLCLADHPLTVTYQSLEERKLAIAGYTLYVDERTAGQLQRLQQAREQVKQDQQAWQAREEASVSNDSHTFGKQEREGAVAILGQLDQQGIEAKHPARDRIEGQERLLYGSYGDYDTGPPTGPKSWSRYPASPGSPSQEEPLLFWRAKDPQQRQHQQENLSQVVRTLLPEPVAWLLRMLFAERMMHTQLDATRKAADTLAESTAIAALLQPKPTSRKSEKKKAQPLSSADLDPDGVWKSYQREAQRFEALTQLWKTQVERLSTLRQLFLLS